MRDPGREVSGEAGRAADHLRIPSSTVIDASELVVSRVDPSAFHFPGILRRPRLTVVRPDDLVVLALEFRNLVVETEVGPDGLSAFLRPTGGSKRAQLIVHLPPQNVAEEAFFEAAAEYTKLEEVGKRDTLPSTPKPAPPASRPIARTLIAGPSQLVFEVPKDVKIPYTVAGVLDALRGLRLSVPATALPPQPPPIFTLPEHIFELINLVAKGVTRTTSPVEVLRAKARLQAWQDVTDLLPVTIRGETSLPPRSVSRTPDAVIVNAEDGRFARTIVDRVSARELNSIITELARRPRLAPPAETETALELPFRLLLSPNRHGAWVHAPDPVESPASGRVELWHTRLGTFVEEGGTTKVEEGDHAFRTVRAVWARSGSEPPAPNQQFSTDPTKRPSHANAPFRMSLDATDRFEIVHESANFNLPATQGKPRYRPEPIDVRRLMLTALGAWIDTRGAWSPPEKFEVEEWRHRGTMARDHYVRVVYKGYCWPFGHRASVVKITERKLHPPSHPGQEGSPAILRQRMFLLVRQPVLEYGHPGMANAAGHLYDHQFPFTRVEITTLVTPNLDDPLTTDYPKSSFDASKALKDLPGGEGQSLFWPHVGTKPFTFHLVAEDLEGRKVEFALPLLFVSNVYSEDADVLPRIKQHYETTIGATLGTAPLHGQRFALAPEDEPGDTQYEADALSFGVEIPSKANHAKLGPDRPRFYPRLRTARIVVPVMKGFTGKADPAVVSFSDAYLKHGFPTGGSGHPNDGQVFLQLAGGPVAFDFRAAGDKAGAFVQPNLDLSGISRRLGPVGGNVATLATGAFTPSQFFDALDARLFGVVELGEVIKAADIDVADLVPKFVTEAVSAVRAFADELLRLEARYQGFRDEVVAAAGIPPAVEADVNALKSEIATHVQAVTDAIDDLLAGATSVSDLTTAVGDLAGDIGAARGLLDAVGPGVSSDVRQTLASTLEAVESNVGKNVGAFAEFAQRLQQALQLPEELTMRFDWRPQLEHWPDKGNEQESIFRARNTRSGKEAVFSIGAEIQAKTKLRPEPRIDIDCRLHNFTLNLIGEQSFLLLHFNKLEFSAKSGKKPDVNVEFDEIQFTGVLSFVEALRTLIPLDGFSDPPALEVSEKGISASFSMALPDIAIGVFSIQNLSLGAGFNVPFLLDPLTVRFNFCERESPFLLTVSAFGGGGFFAITLDPDGVELLEAAFEFGASLSVNLGVASGGVTVMAGIYYKMEVDEATLTGYFRMAGEVDVLGLISACIELYLGLAYEFASGKCAGTATITVEVSVAFFSTSVEISCERKFAGSNGDPAFAELMGPGDDLATDPWTTYCEAFA